MKIDCESVVQLLQDDFEQLWRCSPRGRTLVLTSPYALPNHDSLSLYLTERSGRLIVSEGGELHSFIEDHLHSHPNDWGEAIRDFQESFDVRVCEGEQDRRMYFFKETTELALIPSLVFDLGNFAAGLLAAISQGSHEEEMSGAPKEKTFEAMANGYVQAAADRAPGVEVRFNFEPPETKGIRFSAALISTSRITFISYVTGSAFTRFDRSISNTIVNFDIVRAGILAPQIRATVPLLNDQASGFDPEKMAIRLERLRKSAEIDFVPWSRRDEFKDLFVA